MSKNTPEWQYCETTTRTNRNSKLTHLICNDCLKKSICGGFHGSSTVCRCTDESDAHPMCDNCKVLFKSTTQCMDCRHPRYVASTVGGIPGKSVTYIQVSLKGKWIASFLSKSDADAFVDLMNKREGK